jgi:hypothetical protein
MGFIELLKHKHFILGVIIILVLVCAVMVLNGGEWLEGVHRRYVEPFQVGGSQCDKSYTIKGNPNPLTAANLLDIRYPDSDDFLTFTFNTAVSKIKLTSMTTRQVITSTTTDSAKLKHEVYAEPGEYEMLINYICQPAGPDRNRIVISPVFNFAGRENTYYRLPVTSWSDDDANQKISIDPTDTKGALTLNMQQFNKVEFKVQLPKLAEYKNKLTEIGFGSTSDKTEYTNRIARLESYMPVSIEGELEILGPSDGKPIPKSNANFPSPRLIFPPIGCTDTKMCCLATENCTVTMRNIRTDHKYRVTMYLKYQRPDSPTGYRTTLKKELTITVTDTDGYDLTTLGAGNKLTDYTDRIAKNAELQLKFERAQGIQDVKLGVLEDEQNRVFDMVARV